MVQTFDYTYDDELLRPANADEQIGWSGVPLSKTCGYTGMIPRATVPDSTTLGFDIDFALVDAAKIAGKYMAKLNEAFSNSDAEGLWGLMYEDGWIKDLYMLTNDVRSLRGRDQIMPMLKERLPKTGIKNVKSLLDPAPELEIMGLDLAFITVHFGFDFAHGTGSGMLRLSPVGAKTGSKEELADVKNWKALHISLTMETLMGYDPEDGSHARDKNPKLIDPLGKARTYHQMRADAQECLYGQEPTVLIVGAGHCGLMLAARFKVLGISCLLVEKGDAPGASWSNRYATLSLHNSTNTNTFPYIPFPTHFPDFVPAQQLGKFMEKYADLMDLNVWTRSTIDGENATYDEKTKRWTVTVDRRDSSQRILHPKWLIIASGITGTLPDPPNVPGSTEFEANGGTIVHSSRHRTTPDMTGKKVIVVGAATSAHDLCGELYDNGLDVTMIQRSSSHIISVDKGVRMMYAKFEDLSKPGTLQKADRGTWLSQPYSLLYEFAPRLFKAIREADKETIDALKKVGYRLNDGFHGAGAVSLYYFNLGGYYFDTGVCKLIGEGKVKIEHSEIERMEKGKAILKDGKALDADMVVYANGYFESKTPLEAIMGKKIAEENNEWMEKGNSFIIDPEGELRTYWRPLKTPGLRVIFQQFGYSRYYGARLALNILGHELGLDMEPYGNLPFTPRTKVTMQPRRD